MGNLSKAILICLLSIFLSINTFGENSLKNKLKTYPHIAVHRGGVHSPLRNTLAQFKEAYKNGADIIETDLRLTKDNIVVIFHDKSLRKKTNCSGSIRHKTLTELRLCRFDENNEQIPTLREVLEWSSGKVIINAEFKVKSAIKFTVKLVEDFNAYDWTYFQTRSHRDYYTEVRGLNSDINLLFELKKERHLDWLLNLNDPSLIGVELNRKFINTKTIDLVRSKGLLVSQNSFQFSPNKEKESAFCTYLLNQNFDIIVTDHLFGCIKQRSSYLILKQRTRSHIRIL